MISILLFIFYLAISCHPDPTVNQDPGDIPEINVLWKVPLVRDSLESSTLNPSVFGNHVVGGGERIFAASGEICRVDILTGKLNWYVDCDIHTTPLTSLKINNIFVGLCDDGFTAYNINDGSIVWASDYNGGYQIGKFGDKIFNTHTSGTYPSTSSSLVMADINIGVWDTIYTLDIVDNYSTHIMPPGVMINDSNDTILYFQNRQWNFSESDGKIDLYAYNMTADSLLWVNYDLDEVGNSSIQPPLIYDGKVYFRGSWVLYCFDAATGEKLWDRTFGADMFEDLLFGNTLVINDKLIVKTSGNSIYAFNPDVGNIIWQRSDVGGTTCDMVAYKGNVYYGSVGNGKIHVINATSGRIVKQFDSPGDSDPETPHAGFYKGVAIDSVTNRLFAGDGYYLYCIDIDW